MSRINELKEYWSKRTLEELKVKLYNTKRNIEESQTTINKNANELLILDINSIDYVTRLMILTEYIRNASKTIKDSTRELNILKEILVEKAPTYNFDDEYNSYIKENKENIEVLVDNMKDKNIDSDIFTDLIKSMKDKVGNIQEVNISDTEDIDYNVIGDKDNVNFTVIKNDDGTYKTFSYIQEGNSLSFV